MDTEGIPVREIEPDFYYRMQCGIMYAEQHDYYSDITIWEVVTRTATMFQVPFRVYELAATTRYGFAYGIEFEKGRRKRRIIVQFELANPSKVCCFFCRLDEFKVKLYEVECSRERVRLSMDVFLKIRSKAKWIAATESICYFVGVDRYHVYEFFQDDPSFFESFNHGKKIPFKKIRSLPYEINYAKRFLKLRTIYKHHQRGGSTSPELTCGDEEEPPYTQGRDAIKYIACGSNHVTVVTLHGLVLAYGNNTKEELGLNLDHLYVAHLVPNHYLMTMSTAVKILSVGYFHGAGIGRQFEADRNISLTWGMNPFIQLDEEVGKISTKGNVCIMTPADDGLRLKDVVCEGNQTSYFLGKDEASSELVAVKVCGDEDNWVL